MRNDPAGVGKPSSPTQRLATLTWRLSVCWTDSQLDGDGKCDVNLNGDASGETQRSDWPSQIHFPKLIFRI